MATGKIKVPPVIELGTLQASVYNLVKPLKRFFQIIWMDMALPLVNGDALFREHATKETVDITMTQVVTHDLVLTCLHSFLHHCCREVNLGYSLSDTSKYHAVGNQYNNKYHDNQKQHHQWQKLGSALCGEMKRMKD